MDFNVIKLVELVDFINAVENKVFLECFFFCLILRFPLHFFKFFSVLL